MSAATTTHLSPMTSNGRTPRAPRDKGATTPNYFNPLVSPQSNPADPQPSLEAFRRQSESHTFSLGHSNLSFFSSSSGSRKSSAEISPAGPRAQHEEHALSPLSLPRIRSPVEKETQTVDPMDIDVPSPAHASLPPPARTPNTQSLSTDTPSFFDIPRQKSPYAASPAEIPSRNHITSIDERHPRNSLPHNRVDPPSSAPREPVQRAETLPNSLSKDTPNLISPQELLEIFETYASEEVLLLDVRVFPQYSQSRIDGALNLCIPTTLLKRPAFNVQKLAETFNREKEKEKFAQWREAKVIVVYDASSSLIKDATSSVNTLKKFKSEGWHGSACIIRGGYLGFSKKFPNSIDRRPASEMENTQGRKLSIDPTKVTGAPVAGGCLMPSGQSSANPFFGTIRQNMDLIDGVGQIPISLPPDLKEKARLLPPWLKRATSPRDHGRVVAEYFLDIEKGEQQRMQKALNGTVHYGSPSTLSPDAVRIAGIEKGAKNRYKDMLPYDHSRVRLQNVPPGECDYINASHIKSALSGRQYIASQAPVPPTMEDFWRLVWEQGVHVIVMLTAEHDGGQRKSHPYWDGQYGKYSVKVDSARIQTLDSSRPTNAEDIPSVLIRQITISAGTGESRHISQLHYSGWPDFGVPTDPKHLLGLVRISRGEVKKLRNSQYEPPVLVHCSAGCGRTGTFCTVDSVVATLESRLQNNWNQELFQTAVDNTESEDEGDLIAKTVEDFRLQRLSMVQTLRQFVLCYETVLQWSGEWIGRNYGVLVGYEEGMMARKRDGKEKGRVQEGGASSLEKEPKRDEGGAGMEKRKKSPGVKTPLR